MTGRLEGRHALVTGAGGGLGKAIAKLFAREGATVSVNDIDREAAESVAEECQVDSPRSRAVPFDVADAQAVRTAFDKLASAGQALDILVNNAGVSATDDPGLAQQYVDEPLLRPITEITDEHWHRMLGVHLNGTFFCTRAAASQMIPRRQGSIVCVSSIAALSGFGAPHYSAAKGGVIGLVRAAARSFGPHGIRINAVCPGTIDAGMATRYPMERRERTLSSVPLGRFGKGEEIAYAAVHLASDESAYPTGQWASPNGGLVIA